jgi:hypothetical protein
MASLYKDIFIAADSDAVWDAARDIGALHTRLVPGFVVDTHVAPGERVVTFANGFSMREPIITIDDARRRLVWSSIGGVTTHYNAALEVIAAAEGTRVRWTSDFLPDDVAPRLSAMQDQGLAAMKRAFER